MPANSLFGSIDWDGALTLHVPRAKFPIRYLAGSKTLVFLTKRGGEYIRGNTTTWNKTDTGIKPSAFLRTRFTTSNFYTWAGGEEELNDFINHLANVEEVKQKSLVQKQRVNINSINKTGTTG